MKIKLLVFALLAIGMGNIHAQTKIVADFESNHPLEMSGWDEQPEVVNNPKMTGINTSSKVLAWKKSSGEWKAFVISFDDVMVAEMPILRLKFYSPVVGTVQVRIENETEAEAIHIDIPVTVTNKWMDYTVDVGPMLKGKKYSKIFFFINAEKAGDESTYYLDDVAFAKK